MKRVVLIGLPWMLAAFLGGALVVEFQVLRAERLRGAEWRAEMATRNEVLEEALRIAAPNRWVSHDAKVQAIRRVLALRDAYIDKKGSPKPGESGFTLPSEAPKGRRHVLEPSVSSLASRPAAGGASHGDGKNSSGIGGGVTRE